MAGPSGVVTFLFTDIEGSTALWDRHPSAMRLALERHDELLRSSVETHGGGVFATMGDGFGAVFTRPADAASAALGAQEMLREEAWPVDAPIRVRMGLHSGEAHERDGDYFGPTVNLAARIMSAGHGGQVLASAVVHSLLDGDAIDSVALGSHELAGVGKSQPIVQLGDGRSDAFPPLRTKSPSPQTSTHDRPVLHERDESLAMLGERVEQARAGRGSVVLLAGAAGAGKTSLVDEVAHHASDVVVLRGGCDPLTPPRPHGPLREIAHEDGANIGAIAERAGDPYELYERFLLRLKSPPGPILVIIEDIHWADDATLDLLQYLARRVGRSRAVVVCTYRDEAGVDHRLGGVIGAMTTQPDVFRLTLGPLSVTAIREMVGAESADADSLHTITGGNPYFVSALIQSGETLPATISDAVMARVSPLPAGVRSVIEAVSVAPRSVGLATLRRIRGVELTNVDAAIAAGVLESQGVVIRFRHELARAAVEKSLLPGRRLDLHNALLTELSSAPVPDLAELAHHAIGAGDPQTILGHAPAGAREAVRLGATRQGATLYQAAVDAADGRDPAVAANLRLELADALASLGERERAERVIHRALSHFRDANDRRSLANALTLLARILANSGEVDEPIELLQEAIELLGTEAPGPQLASAHLFMTRIAIVHRNAEVARRHLAMAAAIDDGTNEVTTSDLALSGGLVELVFGDYERGLGIVNERRRVAVGEGNETLVATIDSHLGTMAGEVRRYADAVDALESAITREVDRDHLAAAAYDSAWLAKVHLERGDLEAAERVLVAQPATDGIEGAKHLTVLGRLRVRRGDPGGVESLHRALDLVDHTFLQHSWPIMAGLAERLWSEGRAEEIGDVIGETYRLALARDSAWARGELGYWMWRAGAIDRPPPGAADPFADQIMGEWQRAVDAWRRIGAPFELGLALSDGDDHATAEAFAILEDLGASPAVDRLRREFRAAGQRSIPRGPNATTRANPLGLTGRQAEVLALLVEGLSNGEIADELVVTKKTVEHHVSAIFARLGVTTRSKAIAAVRAVSET